MAMMRSLSKRNSHGIKVKCFCASCAFKKIDAEGNRICKLTKQMVAQKHRCKQWEMSDGLKNAGLPNKGVVRLRGTGEIVIR